MDGTPVHVKLLLLGPLECGKSALVKRVCEGQFDYRYTPTIGIDYGIKKEVVEGASVAVG